LSKIVIVLKTFVTFTLLSHKRRNMLRPDVTFLLGSFRVMYWLIVGFMAAFPLRVFRRADRETAG
jgi:Ni/Fe-hydrogenase subunit HybB-like protein